VVAAAASAALLKWQHSAARNNVRAHALVLVFVALGREEFVGSNGIWV
jgi:hypothetical protein